MNPFFSLLLCVFVLLSGCASLGTAAFKPKPESGEDSAIGIIGMLLDIGLTTALCSAPASSASSLSVRENESLGEAIARGSAPLLISIGMAASFLAVGIDVAIRDSLPYRETYYQQKKLEKKPASPEENPSDTTK